MHLTSWPSDLGWEAYLGRTWRIQRKEPWAQTPSLPSETQSLSWVLREGAGSRCNQICWSKCFRSCQSVCGIRIAKGEATSRLHPHTGWKQLCGHRGLRRTHQRSHNFPRERRSGWALVFESTSGWTCSSRWCSWPWRPSPDGRKNLLVKYVLICKINACSLSKTWNKYIYAYVVCVFLCLQVWK